MTTGAEVIFKITTQSLKMQQLPLEFDASSRLFPLVEDHV